MEQNIYTDKEILQDALCTQKASTSLYNLGANECANKDLRNTMMDLLNKEHAIGYDVFNTMHAKGFYPTPEAETTKIQQAKQKYSQYVQAAM